MIRIFCNQMEDWEDLKKGGIMSAKANPITPVEIKELLDQLPEDQAEAILKAVGLLALKLQKKAVQDKHRKSQ